MHEFMTFKSGKFYFSEIYDPLKIEPLLSEVRILYKSISSLPILPSMAAQIEQEILYSSIAGTAAIEGNPISVEGVKKIAEGHETNEYTKKDRQEIINLIEAYKMLDRIDTGLDLLRPIFREEIICNIHRVITSKIPHEQNIPGKFRNGVVHVGDKAHGGIYTPPKIYEDVRNLMSEFISWINSDDIIALNPFIRGALAHYHFSIIHPFWDGNGRTARLIEAMILQLAGIKNLPKEISNYYYRNVDDYYIAFSKTLKLKKDVTPFLEFTLNAAVSSLTKMMETIHHFIRLLTLRDYCLSLKQQKKITPRQCDLINLLLDQQRSFNLGSLSFTPPFSIIYRGISTQTARRDLKKLTELKLLNVNDKGEYSLNLRALG